MTTDPGLKGRPRRRLPLLVALGAVAAWVLYLAVVGPRFRGPGQGAPPPNLTPPRSGPADYAWELTDLDGRPVDFGEYRGRPVFLNLWATWCPPCRLEMPAIARLAADEAVQDVAFVLVSTEDQRGPIRRYLAENPALAHPRLRYLLAKEPVARYATEGIPATFVIAPDGRVAVEQVGAAAWDAPEVVALLASLSAPAGSKVAD